MNSKRTTIIMIVLCVLGLSLLLYSSVSKYWNEKHATKAINDYVDSLKDLDKIKYEEIWLNAVQYNEDLLKRENQCALTEELAKRYEENLDVTGTGIMGYVEISRLGVSLPIYHGTSDDVLQSAVGHINWSSLPVGGDSTHSVLSGHRGLPSAKLFTDLDNLREGDIFTLTVMDEVLTYEVDQIRTVEPQNVSDLRIEQGEDFCTLVTCTPYGINTHRLLVRGHRVENLTSGSAVIAEAVMIDQLIVAIVLALPLLLVLLLIIMLKKPTSKKPKSISEEEVL